MKYAVSFGRVPMRFTATECLPRTFQEFMESYNDACGRVGACICEYHEFDTYEEAKSYYDAASLEVYVDYQEHSNSNPAQRWYLEQTWEIEIIDAYLEKLELDENGDVCDNDIIESRVDYDAYLRAVEKWLNNE